MKKILLCVAALSLPLAAAGWWAWRRHAHPDGATRPPPTAEDPRLAYHGPFANVHPAVRYVGDAACADCHRTETRQFRGHPMGRSLRPVAELAGELVFDRRHHNPFDALESRFSVERRGSGLWQFRDLPAGDGPPVVRQETEVHYAVGSGSRGYSFLTERDGYLFQAPVSWYAQKGWWDLSPGFDVRQVAERPVGGDCLFCHANQAHPLPGYQNRYARPVFSGHAIGCERCHGPGERHVQSGAAEDIANPGRQRLPDPGLRDAVCAQCHLEGVVRVLRRGRELYDFRPGLPLEPFWSVFVYPEEGGAGRAAVNHFEQMHQSRCFRAGSGAGRLTCVSCHDPHQAVSADRRVPHFRARCLRCHEEHGCRLPAAERRRRRPDDSCVDCHMPRGGAEDVAHTATTDHRIPRQAGRRDDGPAPGEAPFALVPFPAGRVGADDRELKRDLALALVRAAGAGQVHPLRGSGKALALLADSLDDWPDDVEAWEARGAALLMQGDTAQALGAFEQALRLQPDNERVLTAAAALAARRGQADTALARWRHAVRLNPWMADYRRNLALLLLERKDWDEARRESVEWLRLAPASVEARMLWITCLLRQGDEARARAEFARVEALRPPDLEVWRARFRQQLATKP